MPKFVSQLRRDQAWVAAQRPDLPVKEVADYLADNFKGSGTVYSLVEMAKFLPRWPPDLIAAVLGLLILPTTGALRIQWVFIDAAGELFELDIDDVRDAVRAEEFLHPETGRAVHDFRTRISMYYTPQDRLT